MFRFLLNQYLLNSLAFWATDDDPAAAGDPPDDPEKPEPDPPEPEIPEGQPVPYERFRKELDKRKELESKLDDLTAFKERIELEEQRKKREAEEAERLKQMESGNWKELYQTAERKREQAEKEARESARSAMQVRIANEVGLPPLMVERLKGETEEQMRLDALRMLEILPKQAGVADGSRGTGNGNAPRATSRETLVQKKRNANPAYQQKL